NNCVIIELDYTPPERKIRRASAPTCRFRIICPNEEMQKRADFTGLLDPRLTEGEVIKVVEERFKKPLCPHCGKPLVKNGSNGSGTPQYRCQPCRRNMAFYATFEAVIARIIKLLTALVLTVYAQAAVEDIADFLGLSRNILWEALWLLPDTNYKVEGKPKIVSYQKEKIAVVNLDGLFKGKHSLLLAISGKREIIREGHEKTREGLPQLLDENLEGIEADRYLFVIDANITVARWLVERYGEKAVVLMQNHTLWGDAVTYFHHEEKWWTLHLRTDTFTAITPKRRESELLPPGMGELYQGFKGINPRFTLKDYSTIYLEKWALRLLDDLRHLAEEVQRRSKLEGFFLTMFERVRQLNSIIKELRKRGKQMVEEETRRVIGEIAERYAQVPGAKRKRLLMNAWKYLDSLKGEIEELGKTLLGSFSLKKETRREGGGGRKPRNPRSKAVLIYRGSLQEWDEASLSGEARRALSWILGLLKAVFGGEEITNNVCENLFSVVGMGVRKRRSMFLSRALGFEALRRMGLEATVRMIASYFPMDLLGVEAVHRGRVQLGLGRLYFVIYRDGLGEVSFRTVTLLGRVKGVIVIFCHLRQEIRHFIRSRILYAEPL
ncbi:MAG: hypothetical protein QXO71_05005, partial [Candidatus Jordarchaeaceae archaeon]